MSGERTYMSLVGRVKQMAYISEAELRRHVAVINHMSYEEMLRLWRFAPVGHPYFVAGTELAAAFDKHFLETKNELPPGEHAEASKRIGWQPTRRSNSGRTGGNRARARRESSGEGDGKVSGA